MGDVLLAHAAGEIAQPCPWMLVLAWGTCSSTICILVILIDEQVGLCYLYCILMCKNCNLHIGYIALHKQVHCTPSSLPLWFRRKFLIGRTSHVSLYFWCFILLTGNSGTLQPRLLVWSLWWRTRCSSLQVKLLQSCRVMKMLACQRTPMKHAPSSRQLLT